MASGSGGVSEKIAELLKAANGDVDIINKAIKKITIKPDKYADMKKGLVEIIKKSPKITLKRFKMEAKTAWLVVNGDLSEHEKKPLNQYQIFMKDNMAKVIEENPDMKHMDRIKKIGEMWQQVKADKKDNTDKMASIAHEVAAIAKSRSKSIPEKRKDIQEDTEPEPASKRRILRRTKKL